jgi:hypothetical protein
LLASQYRYLPCIIIGSAQVGNFGCVLQNTGIVLDARRLREKEKDGRFATGRMGRMMIRAGNGAGKRFLQNKKG